MPFKLLCFYANGVIPFKVLEVRLQFNCEIYMVLFFMGIHYMAHNTNLAILTFFILPMVAHLKDLLQSIYTFFYKSPKCHLKLIKLTQIMETKGNKLFHNIKI
jgi:hypothetical protein